MPRRLPRRQFRMRLRKLLRRMHRRLEGGEMSVSSGAVLFGFWGRVREKRGHGSGLDPYPGEREKVNCFFS